MSAEGILQRILAANQLVKGKTPAVQVTCTNANTDYAAASAMPAGTAYVIVYCASDVLVAMGEATSSTVGVWVPGTLPTPFPVRPSGVTADDTIHVQCASAGAVVTFTWMKA